MAAEPPRGSGSEEGSSAASPAPQPAPTRSCVSCLEEIRRDARRCPHCGSSQGRAHAAAIAAKWAAAALTLVTLGLGVERIVGATATALEEREAVGVHVKAARALTEVGEYRAAWELLDEAGAPGSREVRDARLALARRWVLRSRALHGSFLDVTERVMPVLAGAVSKDDPSERARAMAYVAFARFLQGRDEPIRTDVAALYREALEVDPDCAVCHLLLGNHLAAFAGDLEGGLSHFDRAFELAEDGRIEGLSVRGQQLAAVRSYLGGVVHVGSESWRKATVARIRITNEMRRRGEVAPLWEEALTPRDRDRPIRELLYIYKNAYSDDERYAVYRDAIPVEEHRDTVQWLRSIAPADTSVEVDAGLAWWIARFQEELGDEEGAVATLASAEPGWGLARHYDVLLLRLAGEPYQPLQKRDPWSHRAQVLGSADPASPEYTRAFDKLDDYVRSHRENGEEVFDVQALAAAESAAVGLAARVPLSPELDERAWRVAFYRAVLMHDAGRSSEALEIVAPLSQELPEEHEIRGDVLVLLAAVRARHSLAAPDAAAQRAAAVKALREAVEEEGWINWALIRWNPDIEPLHGEAAYAELLARHGRQVRSPALKEERAGG